MPSNNITCWIALDDADAENGALRYIAGSHRDTLGLSVDEEGRLEDMDKLLAEGDQCWRINNMQRYVELDRLIRKAAAKPRTD